MILRDWRFLTALGFTASQQILLTLSTYYIAQAGSAIGRENTNNILPYISLFFFFALMAYVASSIGTFFSTRSSNEVWRRYANTTLSKSTENLQHASEKNKKSIAQWLGGEASSTISHACNFYLGMVSTCLNIVLTLFVFYISVGTGITIALAASLAISFILVIILRHKIVRSAGDMQTQRLRALLSIEFTWNSAMFGSKKMRDNGFLDLDKKVNSYFGEFNKYVILEQIIACCPIIISTVAVIGLLQYSELFTIVAVGTLIAVLPRSLQVFGNVHSLSVYLSQFYLVRTKLRNLENFPSRLDVYHLMHDTSLKGISVCETATSEEIQPKELIAKLRDGEITVGRYTITGNNGSGKSSFLKIVKGAVADSILMTPETSFLDSNSDLSTGQARIKEIEGMFSSSPSILMLDEWDANLDDDNYKKIDMVLNNASRRGVVIEVRHLRQGQTEINE